MLRIYEAVNIAIAMNGYNKKRLATEINMSASALTDFLNGKTTKLDITKAQGIANTLGCTLDYLVGDDTLGIDVSEFITAERDEQGITTSELASETRIPELWILKFESGDEPISAFLFDHICKVFGMTVPEFMVKYELYDEYIPEAFHGDVNAYEAFKEAERIDAMKEKSNYPELRDIVENGWYTVDGFPARRSYKLTLEQTVKIVYYTKYTVAVKIENDDDRKLTIEEIIFVCKQLATTSELKSQLAAVLTKIDNAPDDKKFDILYSFYLSIMPAPDYDYRY